MTKLRLALAVAAPFAAGLILPTQAALAKDVTIEVITLTTLDKADRFSDPDFFARATIDGKVVKSDPVKQTGEIKPGWKLTATGVKSGNVPIKLEILDKDISVDDPIDINRVDRKRDLDFTLNTKTCRITGFSSTYRCKSSIKRAGAEDKKAEITFKVTVK